MKNDSTEQCDEYYHINKQMNCPFVSYPIINNWTCTIEAASTILLISNQKSFLIFDRGISTMANYPIIISFKFNFKNNFQAKQVNWCLHSIEKSFNIKNVRIKKFAGLRTVVPMSNGNVSLLFEDKYCIMSIGDLNVSKTKKNTVSFVTSCCFNFLLFPIEIV